jgi:hypothetical protein
MKYATTDQPQKVAGEAGVGLRERPIPDVHRAASPRIAVSPNLPFVASRSILDRPTSGTAFQLE